MRYSWLAALSGLLTVTACTDTSPPTEPSEIVNDVELSASRHDSKVHVMPIRSVSSPTGALVTAAATIPIAYHGGPILPVTKVAAIYWAGAAIYAGQPAPGTSGAGTNDGSLIGYFLNHLGGSNYFNINTTYYDQVAGGHTVQNVVTYTQYWAANTNVPPSSGSAVSNATIQAQIIAGFTSGKLAYDPQTVYAVFTAGNTNLGGSFGTVYCAYHGIFTWSSPQGARSVIYAAMPYVNQYPTQCTSNLRSPNNDPAADREISALAHEVEEATTDYALNAWYDANHDENADKCIYNWGTQYALPNTGRANMGIGAKHFLIQQNWVNQGAGSCIQWLGGITASGGLSASMPPCVCATPQPVISSVVASGNAIIIKDNGGHTATMTLTGATGSGGLTASVSCGVFCTTPAAITSIVASGSTITIKDNGGHTGTITVAGAKVAGGLTASITCLCNTMAAIGSVIGTNNRITLQDSGAHTDYILIYS